MKTDKALYLFELKLNMSAQAAMKQIDLKDYASKFALSGLPIVKVGINFDPERRTIGDWKVEDAQCWTTGKKKTEKCIKYGH